MEKKTIKVFCTVALGTIGLVTAIISQGQKPKLQPVIEHQKAETKEPAVPKPPSTPISMENILSEARKHAVTSSPRQEIIDDLEEMVKKERINYEKVNALYQEVVEAYGVLSASYDRELRKEAPASRLASIKRELEQKAQEIDRFREDAHRAYLSLMIRYDEAVPVILTRYF